MTVKQIKGKKVELVFCLVATLWQTYSKENFENLAFLPFAFR